MFLSLDPDPSDEDDIFTQKGYSYANNSPVKHVDPDGHWVWLVVNPGFATYDGYKAYKAGKNKKQIALAIASNFGPGKAFKGAKKVYGFAKKAHGNSKSSKVKNHLYEIYHKKTREIVKVGISSGKVSKEGSSYRAISQVNKCGKPEPILKGGKRK